MGKINMGRVMGGGLLAGLIINIGEFILNGWVLEQDWPKAMQSLNRPALPESAIPWFVGMGFALGIATVWTYAAIRSRFGAGPKTAVCAGLLVWFFSYLCPSVSLYAMDLFAARFIAIGTIWALFEVPIAAAAGGWLYKES